MSSIKKWFEERVIADPFDFKGCFKFWFRTIPMCLVEWLVGIVYFTIVHPLIRLLKYIFAPTNMPMDRK